MGYSKKILVVLGVSSLLCTAGKAQLEGKILQTMLDQLAALNGYAAVADQGYQLVENGLHGIAIIRQGEWNLHKTYYGSLLTVNPAVREMPEAAEIVQKASWLLRAGRTKEAADAISDLATLLTDGKLTMTDGERMRRIIALNQQL